MLESEGKILFATTDLLTSLEEESRGCLLNGLSKSIKKKVYLLHSTGVAWHQKFWWSYAVVIIKPISGLYINLWNWIAADVSREDWNWSLLRNFPRLMLSSRLKKVQMLFVMTAWTKYHPILFNVIKMPMSTKDFPSAHFPLSRWSEIWMDTFIHLLLFEI